MTLLSNSSGSRKSVFIIFRSALPRLPSAAHGFSKFLTGGSPVSYTHLDVYKSQVQGSAADIIKLAMVKVYNRLRSEGLRSRLILQVHDELIVEAPFDEAEHVKEILKQEMEGAVTLDVPLTVEMSEGASWYDAK